MDNRRKNLFCTILFIAAFFTYSSTTFAQNSSSQNLTSVLPDNVLFFATTSGGDILKPEFEKTILGRIWNDPNVKTFYQSIQKSFLQKAQQQPGGSEASTIFNMATSIGSIVASRPIIIGAAQKTTQQGPPVYGFAFLDAGTKKGQISGILSNLEAMAGQGAIIDVNVGTYKLHGPRDAAGVPGYWGWVGNYLVFAINDGEGLAIKYLQGSTGRQAQAYIEEPAGAKDLLAIYISVDKGLSLLKNIAAEEGQADKFAIVDSVLGQLGLNKIKTISTRTGFEGSGMVMDELIEIPEPRTGLFACLKTINLDMFNMVSANATSVSIVNMDIAGIYDTVMTTIKSVAGSDFQEIEQGIAQLESQTGVKIRQGLLESLNGQMVTYNLSGGASLQSLQGGFVIIAGLKNAQLWQDSIAAIGKFATEQSNGTVQVSSQSQNGRTLNTFAIIPLAVAQIMPTWTIVGENVVIGSNPTICTTAADLITPGGKPVTISSSESFRNATANLPSNLISFQYTDSKVQLTQMMAVLQQLWPVATMYVSQQGITLPLILPNISNIIKDITPSVQYSYFDQKGLRSYYKGAGIEPSLGAIAGGAVALGIMMPAMSKAREQSKEVVSRSNLKQLALASIMYADDHNGQLPDNFEQMKDFYKNSKLLDSPLKPAGFNGPSYIYVKGLLLESKSPQNCILIYENPLYCSNKVNVAFLDGHVVALTRNDFLEKLKSTYELLGKPLPEIKFKD